MTHSRSSSAGRDRSVNKSSITERCAKSEGGVEGGRGGNTANGRLSVYMCVCVACVSV